MEKVAWIGPKAPPSLRPMLLTMGYELIELSVIDPLLESLSSPVAAVLVAAEWGPALPLVEHLAAARPEVQIIAVTAQSVPRSLRDALRAGATQVIDMGGSSNDEVAGVLGRALGQQRRVLAERRFLAELRTVNDEFLRALVLLDKRNEELLSELRGDGGRTGPAQVLVVDDEPNVSLLLKMALEEEGYEVTLATSAEAAYALLRDKAFQLVITDKNLPGESGHDLIARVRKDRPESEIIMITAYGSKDSVLGAINSGVSAYLEKPFADLNAVCAKVREVLEAPRRRAEQREYLRQFKERHGDFLERYQRIRAELEAFLAGEPRG
jgi:DNA-binding NtrC family response regulator